MAISSSDISVVLSGGTANIDPNAALGGNPSASPVVDGSLNNLFDNLSSEQTEDGHEDYRCIYFFNDGESSIYDVALWIAEDFEGGATIELGTQLQDETQRITLSNGPITGGSMTLSYAGQQFTSNYNSSLAIWASTMEAQLKALTDSTGDHLLYDVSVSAQYAGTGSSTVIFDVLFTLRDGYRNHPVIQLVSEAFTPTTVDVSIATLFEGSPINTIASEIGVETTPPGNVGFFAASESSPISLARLDPEDGFPIWVKRTAAAGTAAVEQDGFRLRFSAQTIGTT